MSVMVVLMLQESNAVAQRLQGFAERKRMSVFSLLCEGVS